MSKKRRCVGRRRRVGRRWRKKSREEEKRQNRISLDSEANQMGFDFMSTLHACEYPTYNA